MANPARRNAGCQLSHQIQQQISPDPLFLISQDSWKSGSKKLITKLYSDLQRPSKYCVLCTHNNANFPALYLSPGNLQKDVSWTPVFFCLFGSPDPGIS